ncbi:MAG TPA: Hsp20/alpha crystallin family protein [Rhodospirillales bacterium]|nr:Hsp20/alpha crystallin family protein [Rhodospirillales bacterium]
MVDMTGEPRASQQRGAESTRTGPVFLPTADIYENKDALFLSLELPGVDPQTLGITLEKRVLTVTGRAHAAAPHGYSLTHTEYRDGDYERSFTLSEAIDADRIEAELTDGLLRLKLPKAQPAPAKTIHVKAAG